MKWFLRILGILLATSIQLEVAWADGPTLIGRFRQKADIQIRIDRVISDEILGLDWTTLPAS